MSTTVDQRVVEMQFNNKQFESNVHTTMSTLDKLRQSLNLSGASKGLENIEAASKRCDVSGISNAVETVRMRFSALEVAAVTALMNITNSAMNAGKRIVSALTIDPIKTGFQEYETKMNAIQTIMSNTASKGTTMADVTRVIDELNTYADKTIYNFAEMTRNIGTFTAAGVGLDESAKAIQGIANLAAASGSNSQQASTAMYQLSQALSTGTIRLMDWNSVVNAGMGGEKFQNAIKDTAREHGVAVDEIIEQSGSFRDSLQKEWLSADILNETLNKFTVDGATNYAKSMMESGQWTQEQADALIAEAHAMEDAATKVKTFTQLWDTLCEAAQSGWGKTWEILVGDFEEAKELFTEVSDVIGGMIDASSDARNNMLQSWKDMGGRVALIDSLRNAFEGVMSVLKPIGEAFREIFPPITAQQLYAFTEGLRDLTSKMKLSDAQSENLKRTFRGLFTVLGIVKDVVFGVIGVVANLVGGLFGLSDGVLGLTGFLGELLTNLGTFIRSAGEKFVTPGFDGFQKMLGFLQNGLSGLLDFLNRVKDGIADAIGSIGNSLGKNLQPAKFDGLFALLNGVSFGAIAVGLVKFFKSISKPIEDFKGIFTSIGDSFKGIVNILDSVRGCFEAYQQNIKAGTLMKIAVAIALLVGSIVVLSMIDSGKMFSALAGMAGLFAELLAAMAIFEKISGSAKKSSKTIFLMIGMATAVLILSFALKQLAELNWGELFKGLTGIAVMMGMLVGAAKIMSESKGKMLKGAANAVLMAIAIKILASACEDLGKISPESLLQGLGAIAVLLTEIAVFTKVSGNAGHIVSTGVALLVLSIGIKILASAVSDFGAMDWETIARGLVAMAGSLLEIGIAMRFMPKDMIITSVGLTVVAIALNILASALGSFGNMSWDSIARGLFVLGASLVELAIGLTVMSGTLAGSAALLVAAVAIAILAPALSLLGSMSWEGIGKALLTVAGALVVFGVAAAVLAPLLPAILGLAGALALIGIGVAAIGIGLLAAGMGLTALATGFGMLASMGAAGATAVVTALGTIITGIAAMIPTILQKIGEGIVAFCGAIVQGAPAICEAVVSIAQSVVTALVTVIPMVVDGMMQLLLALLNGVAENLPRLIQAGVDIIVAFAMGVASAIPQLVDAGFKAIIEFVNGLAEAIRTNTPLLMDAVSNLFQAIIEAGIAILTGSVDMFSDAGGTIMNSGLVDGLWSQVSNVGNTVWQIIGSAKDKVFEWVGGFVDAGWNLITGLADGIWNAAGSVIDAAAGVAENVLGAFRSVFDEHSPSKETMQMGMYLDEGSALGLIKGAKKPIAAAKTVGENILGAMAKALSRTSGILDEINGEPTIQPVMDLSNIQNGISSIDQMMSQKRSMALAGSISTESGQTESITDSIVDAVKVAVDGLAEKLNQESGGQYELTIPVILDGRQLAKASATYTQKELDRLNKINARIGGVLG